jgi:F-box/leucine-rich repeat protein 14
VESEQCDQIHANKTVLSETQINTEILKTSLLFESLELNAMSPEVLLNYPSAPILHGIGSLEPCTAASLQNNYTNTTATILDLPFSPISSSTLLDSTTPTGSTSGTSILHLYPEILTEVFNLLDTRDKCRLSQTCQYFNQIAKNRQIWRGVEAKLNLKPSQSPILSNLVSRGISRVQVLSLKRSLRELTSSVRISHLKLSGCYNVTDYSLSSMQNLESLVSLDLSLCKQITDLSLFSIVGKAPNLRSLDLGGCCNLSDKGILLISYGLRNLKELDLRSCYNLTDRALSYLSGDVKILDRFEIKTYNFLAKLGLIENPNCVICKRGNKNNRNLPKIDDRTEFGMLSLQSLVLQDCQKISDQSLHSISSIPTVERLNLSFCVSITDNGLKYLKELRGLKELNLRSCDNISDMGIVNLKENTSTLEHLDVSFCEKITSLNQHICRGLKTLSLSACDIEDEALIGIRMEKLETLNLGQCSKITDKGLESICEKCPKLKYIDLYGCSRITTKGLEAVMRMPKLKDVNLGLWKV